MPLTVARLRRWFAIAALAVVVVVAGFYFYGRMRIHQALEKVHTKLGVDIQQSSEGFSLSKSQGGKTLFMVRARQAVQYKQGGRAELRDVSIVVYGRTGDRFDQIYGSDFEYDPQTGNIVAKGEVHIDLEANSQGARQPDQTPPQELKNPIHLKTNGLIFNRDSGLAHTDQQIEFRIPQASGTAVGATYDSKSNTMTLHSEVRIRASSREPADIDATRAVITKDPRRAVLDRVHISRPGSPSRANLARPGAEASVVDADRLTVFLRDDNSVDHLVAAGNVRASKPGTTTLLATAPRAEFFMNQHDSLRQGILSGGVSLDAGGERSLQARAARVRLDFGPENRLAQVHAADNVHLVQGPAERSASQPQTVEIQADAMDFLVKDGTLLERAETSGASRLLLTEAAVQNQPETKTVVTAERFLAAFGGNRLQSLTGSPDSRVVSTTPGQPQKVSTGKLLRADFSPAGQIVSILQEGDFHYTEGQRSAWAERAQFTSADHLLLLTGSPRIVESGVTTTADLLRINRQTGNAAAQGNVKTTYSELKPQPGGALLATADPVHVTAQNMTAQRATGTAEYTGGARLWQGANIVQAPVIDFNRQTRALAARGAPGQAVSTVFVQQDKKGKVTPVNVTAARLEYTDAQRKARFTGSVVLKGADATVTADQVEAFLQQRTQAAGVVGPSHLDHVVASGHVLIQEPNRRARGDKLVYTASEEKFVLTGGPPSIFDAEHGTTTGDSLTFFSRDDRVLVEGKTSPTVTQTRVAK